MSNPLYVIHENPLGERRYQPRVESGEKLWLMPRYWSSPIQVWERGRRFDWEPMLCRSSRRAARIARRAMRPEPAWLTRRKIRHQEAELRNEFKEVEHD